jgi:hypothetical protein
MVMEGVAQAEATVEVMAEVVMAEVEIDRLKCVHVGNTSNVYTCKSEAPNDPIAFEDWFYGRHGITIDDARKGVGRIPRRSKKDARWQK